MPADAAGQAESCNCLAVRMAARRLTQFYDQFLVPSGLRTTQFGILAKLKRLGPMTINALAEALVMDRTTLGRNILPLQRDGLVAVAQGSRDRRRKELQLTEAGAARLRSAMPAWTRAQQRFEETLGSGRAGELRSLLHTISGGDLSPAASAQE
ncbi:MAG: winged helix-turn-helix transcriptional regulator [Alphaproteobacteria bacterium]|nr:winged helix-turn-helix transcriptional regulator [Alphaproteobacteria bacterium]